MFQITYRTQKFKNNIVKLNIMKPTNLKERMQLTEDEIFEDENTTGMTDEELKIESLKIATNIGKLMSNVTTEDIVNIAETVAKFIKGGDNASLETTTDETSDTDDNVEDTDTESDETPEDFNTETPEEPEGETENESAEDFEI